MKYIVSRTTSPWPFISQEQLEKERPCTDAVLEAVTFDDGSGPERTKRWVIDVPSIDAFFATVLSEFGAGKVNEIVVKQSECAEYPTELEIYDGYRE